MARQLTEEEMVRIEQAGENFREASTEMLQAVHDIAGAMAKITKGWATLTTIIIATQAEEEEV